MGRESFFEVMTSDRKLKASREGSKGRIDGNQKTCQYTMTQPAHQDLMRGGPVGQEMDRGRMLSKRGGGGERTLDRRLVADNLRTGDGGSTAPSDRTMSAQGVGLRGWG